MASDHRTPIALRLAANGGALAALASGCGILEGGTRHFTVRVDSVAVAASISAADALEVRFFGMVGPSGCYQLDDVRSGRTLGLLQIEFRGVYHDDVCIQEPTPLDYRVRLAPPLEDPFTIRVVQPSGPPLTKTVDVR